MKVLIWSTGQDTGGQGWRIAEAFRKYAPDWQVDARAANESILGYPSQVNLPLIERKADVLRLYKEADVVHLRNNLTGWQLADRGQSKPTIVHHHGSQFRDNHGRIANEARNIGAVQVAATLDLTMLEPDVRWIPSPYDVDELSRLKRYHSDGRIRIAYFPTSPKIKSAPFFSMAARRLRAAHPEVEILSNVINGRVKHVPWKEVLAQKAQADILFDQVILGYGNNAIESWCMGTPVVAGVLDPKVRALMVSTFGKIPFVQATEQTIYDVLLKLVESPDMRAEYAALGLEHVRRFHDASRVVEALTEVYESAPPTRSNVHHFVATSPRMWTERRTKLRARQLAVQSEREARKAMSA